VFGVKVVRERERVILKFYNSWLILNVGGGPTDDKPNITLEPPSAPFRIEKTSKGDKRWTIRVSGYSA
jgi:hypothetical protein